DQDLLLGEAVADGCRPRTQDAPRRPAIGAFALVAVAVAVDARYRLKRCLSDIRISCSFGEPRCKLHVVKNIPSHLAVRSNSDEKPITRRLSPAICTLCRVDRYFVWAYGTSRGGGSLGFFSDATIGRQHCSSGNR